MYAMRLHTSVTRVSPKEPLSTESREVSRSGAHPDTAPVAAAAAMSQISALLCFFITSTGYEAPLEGSR
jgi:hypothetical protein